MAVWSLTGAEPVDRYEEVSSMGLSPALTDLYANWSVAPRQPLWVCDDLDAIDKIASKYNVSLLPLDEVKRVRLREMFPRLNLNEWEDCEGTAFGVSMFGEAIVEITDSRPGIYAIGDTVTTGDNLDVFCLAASFEEWFTRVIQFRGVDMFLVPGSHDEVMPPALARRVRSRMIELNPGLVLPDLKN